jgi:hypothetical protein
MSQALFQKKFDRETFTEFARSFVAGFEISESRAEELRIFKKVEQIGISKKLDLVVFAIENVSGVQARVEITKNTYTILKSHGMSHALVAFYSNDSTEWRLSLITTTVRRTAKGVKEEVSSPRRFSYVLGPNAKIVTPSKQLAGTVLSIKELLNKFSLEVVNQDFYTDVSRMYTMLVGGTRKKVTYPRLLDIGNHAEDAYANFAIRMIGRIVFCWFLKQKKSGNEIPLISTSILSVNAVKSSPDYYHRVCEPLFFELLNKAQDTRTPEIRANDDFMMVPYLNGGLFDAHEEDNYSTGTTTVPDVWLHDFLTILEQYNFTIDENLSIDTELSVDPEMLGRIFENLLAEVNPETGESARKATGSFYTPREIVDYMVDESLITNLITKTGIDEKKIRALSTYDLEDDAVYLLTEDEKKEIVSALHHTTVLDPACGSGAFPIGILQKIVHMLNSADADCRIYLDLQLAGASPEFRSHIQVQFANSNLNYIRKLGVIRECIHGVDIQPIATDISRLRCFLTLMVDQHIDDSSPNRGIEPLPNLEFKFICANTLLSLQNDSPQTTLFDDYEGIAKLKAVRDGYFTATSDQKQKFMYDFAMAQNEILRKVRSMIVSNVANTTNSLTDWEPFKNKLTPWFDPHWMFGLDGFDIVIGNPPYVLLQGGNRDNRQTIYFRKHYKVASYKLDLYHLFIEQGINLLNEAGTISFITPSNFTSNNYAVALRRFLLTSTSLDKLVFFNDGVFDANVHNLVFVARKTKLGDTYTIFYKAVISDSTLALEEKSKVKQKSLIDDMCLLVLRGDDATESILHKMIRAEETLGSVATVNFGMQLRDRSKYPQDVVESPVNKESLTKFHRECYAGKDIRRFYIAFTDRYCFFNREAKCGGCWDENVHNSKSKILVRQIGQYPEGGLDSRGFAVLNAAFMIVSKTEAFDPKFLLGLLNSAAIRFYWLNKFRDDRKTFPKIKGEYLKLLPIPRGDFGQQAQLIQLVVRVIAEKTKNPNSDISIFEHEIDQLVYKLYDLTPEEIQIVEAASKK